ncbi:MAG: Omp28-related outer membrane protein [Flavobacteriales bacterium]|nr:Omp28-related outer membrane protein [Flavobacteriales bacterium]
MKNAFLYLIFIAFTGIYGCDKIDNPIPPVFGDVDWSLYPGDSNNYLTLYNFDDPSSNWSANTNTSKNILLEDYTGHKCTNCPAAAVIAKQLEDDASLGVVLVSVHAGAGGAFQETDSEFITDFTTDAGDVYVVDMPGMFANPLGTINRNPTGANNTVWHASSSWANTVSTETSASLLANIQVQANHFPSTNGLFIHTETEFKDNLTGDYHLIIYLIRESVIAPQKMGDGSIDHHYHHHSILSDNINGTWGSLISSGSIANGTKFYNDFSVELTAPSADSTYDVNNLSLVTYLCERNTFKILQVVKTELN